MEQEAPATLEAEVSAALADAPPDPLAPPPPGADPGSGPPPDPAAEWRPFMGNAVTLTDKLILPQWDLSEEEKTELTESLAGCMAQLFPDGLNGKYACWFRLIAVATVIPAIRYVQNDGKLPPLGPKRKKKPADDDSVVSEQSAGEAGSAQADPPLPN